MIGAGTIINPLIKVVTTVAILAAVYFLLVKPVLDTTNDAFESVGLDGIPSLETLPTDIQDQIDSALDGTDSADARRLADCIARVEPDTDKIQRCVERFSP